MTSQTNFLNKNGDYDHNVEYTDYIHDHYNDDDGSDDDDATAAAADDDDNAADDDDDDDVNAAA